MKGLAVLLVLAAAALGAHQQSLADPPVCPERIPGVTLNITFYPNEDDCSKYWECDNGNLYNGSCSDGLVWNPNVDSCDWPYIYDCPYDKKEQSLLPGEVPQLQSRADPPVCPERIPGVAMNITFYPNEDDCSKYWECDNGNLYNGSCADGLVWNPNVDSCDWPYIYDCPYDKKEQILLPGEVPQLQSRADPPVCPERIPGVAMNITFYPNEDDCSKYWECDNGNLYNGSCADGLVWNPNVNSCDWPYNYDCPYDKKEQSLLPGVVPQLQSRADPPVCPERIPGVAMNITFYPNEDDCSKYWECDNGNLYNGSCADGLVWNPNVNSCDWPYIYDCPYDKKEQGLLPGEVPQLQSRADPPVCPERIPGVAMNITFYPNEDDCSKYWECDNGNLYNGSCADGLVWNPNVNSCDWPYIYDCPYDKKEQSLLPGVVPQLQSRADPPVCPERIPGVAMNITFYPNENDCSKYWECDNGNLYNGSCADGLVWNPNVNSCDWPYNYDCPYDKKEQSLLPGEVPQLQSRAEPPVCPERIPGVAMNITFYPNEDDCSKYWECDNGNLYNGSCADGLVWNPNVNSCDWPYIYDCPYDKKEQSLLPGEVPQLQSRADPPVCPERIPGVAMNITFYPNEDDCSKYWECDNGNLYNGSCADGLVWNPNVNSCDWPYNYDCPYDKKEQSLLPGEVPQLQSRADPPVCPERIPGVAMNITFYPNEDDCSKYWECDNGNLYNGSCADGLVWNPNVNSCDWPYNYDCPYDKKEQSLLPGEVPQLQSRADPPVCPERIPGVAMNITFYPNEDDCSKYWECDNGNLYNGSCADGLVWNPNVNSCDWPYIYDCPYDKKEQSLLPGAVPQLQSRADPPVCPERIPGVAMNITFYPNEDDCSKYWECDNGNLYNGSCADGLVWNPNVDSCDWPYNYDCPYDKKEQSLLSSKPTECPQTSNGKQLTVTFYPDEKDCTKFWSCDNGNLFKSSCPVGLIWNPKINACDWPYNYKCQY